jgi:hypothetical protein
MALCLSEMQSHRILAGEVFLLLLQVVTEDGEAVVTPAAGASASEAMFAGASRPLCLIRED